MLFVGLATEISENNPQIIRWALKPPNQHAFSAALVPSQRWEFLAAKG